MKPHSEISYQIRFLTYLEAHFVYPLNRAYRQRLRLFIKILFRLPDYTTSNGGIVLGEKF